MAFIGRREIDGDGYVTFTSISYIVFSLMAKPFDIFSIVN